MKLDPSFLAPKKAFYEVLFVWEDKMANVDLPSPSFYPFFDWPKNRFVVDAVLVFPRFSKIFVGFGLILVPKIDVGFPAGLMASNKPEGGSEPKRLAGDFCVSVVGLSF